MRIEPVGANAAPDLAALHAHVFERGWSAAEFATLLDDPSTFALAASSDAIAGFVLARVAAGEAEILTIAVAPAFQRNGVGGALVAYAASVSHSLGAKVLHLEVAEDNEAARALYAGLGFSESGRRKGYYARAGAAADALMLRRILPLAAD